MYYCYWKWNRRKWLFFWLLFPNFRKIGWIQQSVSCRLQMTSVWLLFPSFRKIGWIQQSVSCRPRYLICLPTQGKGNKSFEGSLMKWRVVVGMCLLAEAVKVMRCGSGCPWHWTWWTGTQNFTLRCYISSGWSACASSFSMETSLLINSSNDYHFFFFICGIMVQFSVSCLSLVYYDASSHFFCQEIG